MRHMVCTLKETFAEKIAISAVGIPQLEKMHFLRCVLVIGQLSSLALAFPAPSLGILTPNIQTKTRKDTLSSGTNVVAK